MINTRDYFSTGRYLEIGPLDRPFMKRPKYDVYYLDFYTTDEIKKIYKDSYANFDKIVDIDYPTGNRTYSETVGEARFDGVYSAHCIEHTFDVIRHFQDVGHILKENGRYVFAIPDKTNCFDAFRAPTSFREAYHVFRGGTLAYCIADCIMNTGLRFDEDGVKQLWNHESSFLPKLLLQSHVDFAHKIYQSDDPNALAPSCHKWVFTYESIFELLRDCLRMNLLPFVVEAHECTTNDTNYNIYVVLQKKSEMLARSDSRMREILKIQSFLEKRSGITTPWSQLFDGTLKKAHVYLYGAGVYGSEMCKTIKDVLNIPVEFIVSDDEYLKYKDCHSITKVHPLSEIDPGDDIFIFITTFKKGFVREIENALISRGFKKGIHYW